MARILLCWVCARASQADAQNYRVETAVETGDKRFDKYAGISEQIISEAILCILCLSTVGVGVAAVAETSIPASLVLLLSFSDSSCMHTHVFCLLRKLCAKHSVRRAMADSRWKSETGFYAILNGFTRAQTALRLRNRFDSVANCLFALVSDMAYKLMPHEAIEGRSTAISGDHMEKAVVSGLAFVNAFIEAHSSATDRLRVRNEFLDTALYQSMKLLEAPEFEHSMVNSETRRFRRAYSNDISMCNSKIQ
ncbi:hypothetical protein GGH16_002028 [Coemansia sp. RSA 560]|nr:hypothetical protein GGH16_002028 [Coemansia sp. RSA 560]